MRNIAIKTLLLIAAALTIASTADAQIIKRNKPKKLSVKAQLAIERQRRCQSTDQRQHHHSAERNGKDLPR